MTDYVVLVAASANRVYTEQAPALLAAELAAFGQQGLHGRIGRVEQVELGGLPYLGFTVDGGLDGGDLRLLSHLSSAYALFERVDEELLRPVRGRPLDRYDDDLLTVQKYAGKTNEHFTKLLLNVTVLAAQLPGGLLGRRWTVLDPVAGRATTCNQALMYGWDAIGIEIDGKDVDAYAAFLKTWLKRKRIKHHAEMTPVRRDGKRIGRRFDVRIGDARAEPQHLTLFEADTVRARELMKARSTDVIVADLPYGVVHGSRSSAGLRRGPVELLESALPGWVELLRPGGALGMSWNTLVAPRDLAVTMLEAHGLRVRRDWDGFAHRVDQSIQRDIVVAVRPTGP